LLLGIGSNNATAEVNPAIGNSVFDGCQGVGKHVADTGAR
jgi:hypothetical protein